MSLSRHFFSYHPPHETLKSQIYCVSIYVLDIYLCFIHKKNKTPPHQEPIVTAVENACYKNSQLNKLKTKVTCTQNLSLPKYFITMFSIINSFKVVYTSTFFPWTAGCSTFTSTLDRSFCKITDTCKGD